MNVAREIKNLSKITIIVFLAIQILNVILGAKVGFNFQLFLQFAFTTLYCFAIGAYNTYLNYFLDTLFLKNKYSKTRIFTNILASFLGTIIIIFLLRVFEEVVVDNRSFSEYISKENPKNYVVAITITLIITISIYLFHFYKAFQENKVKEQKIIAGTANAKFESLKNQIDPHFLFNSLNVLSSLIEENPEAAQKFTTSLSKVYRYVLEQKDKELVTVQEELNFAKTYMNLLKMRFENSIAFEIATDMQNLEAKIVPLSLQLVLENCIKHNIVSEAKPLSIQIYEENNTLIIENNLQKKEVLGDRKGVGLENIVNRYALISQRKVAVEQTENYFKIKLPILTKQISIMETQYIADEKTAYIRAKTRVDKLKGFYGNLISYCIVIPILIIINLNTSSNFWFWFPMFGWGIGLSFHALETFGFGKQWEENKVKKIINQQQNTNERWK
jgi:sensor histidine kinase YesM